MDPRINPPPLYSSLPPLQDPTLTSQKEPNIDPQDGGESLVYENWVYHANPLPSMWSRRSGTISPDHVNISYGISNDAHCPPLRIEPEIFFTCRLQPRNGDAKDKDYIHMWCCVATALTVLHRKAGGKSCDCNWWTLKDPSQGCLLHPWGLLWIKKRWQTRRLREVIRDHDRLCSCGCFDITA